MECRPQRARPRARFVAWGLVSAGVLLAGADAVSRFRTAVWVGPSTGGAILSDGSLRVMAVLAPSTRIVQPAPGFALSRLPAGYGVASRGAAREDRFAGFITTIHEQTTGALQWVMVNVRLFWLWAAAWALGAAGLVCSRRLRAGLCQTCGYPLHGLPGGAARCPECGTALPAPNVTLPAARP